MSKEAELNRAITLNELKLKAKGILVEIPDFEEGKVIKVRLKKIDFTKELLSDKFSLTSLLSESVITKTKDMSEQQREKFLKEELEKRSNEKGEGVQDIMPMIDDVCKQALLEPTYDDFEAHYPLVLNQKYAIFKWVLGGIADMRNFR